MGIILKGGKSFNSTLVQSKQIFELINTYEPDIVSIPHWFNQNAMFAIPNAFDKSEFQFHTGSIKT